MQFTSDWKKGNVFWRTFTAGDTVYIIGLKQGTIGGGGTVTYNNAAGFFQMELKRGDIFGPTLVEAGQKFSNDDEYILTEDGAFITVADAASVTVDPVPKIEEAGSIVQFFTQGSTDSSIKLTSTMVQTTTQTGSSQSTITNEATDENGVQVGAKATAGGGDGKGPGVEVTPSISSKVTTKITEAVATQLSVTVSTQSTYTEEQPVTLKADKLTAIETSWQRKYATGSVVLRKLQYQFEATLGYFSSRNVSEYDSPDQLPPELMAAYRAQNPGYHAPVDLTDGSVLREQDNAPVMVIFGGAKFWIPNPDVLNQLYGGWGKVVVVPDGSLASVPSTPRDGTILREQDHAEVWLMEGGKKRHITSPDVLARYGGWGVVHVVPDDATVNFPEGDPVV